MNLLIINITAAQAEFLDSMLLQHMCEKYSDSHVHCPRGTKVLVTWLTLRKPPGHNHHYLSDNFHLMN